MGLEKMTLSNISAGRLELDFEEALDDIRRAWREGRRDKASLTIRLVLTPDDQTSMFKTESSLSVTLPPKKQKSTAIEYGENFMIQTGSRDVRQPSLFLEDGTPANQDGTPVGGDANETEPLPLHVNIKEAAHYEIAEG
jgi:hypothetical protein